MCLFYKSTLYVDNNCITLDNLEMCDNKRPRVKKIKLTCDVHVTN